MRLYLDMCVYNRPFDDQSQPRIMLETQIFIMMLLMISKGRFDLINSFALEYENSKNPNIENMLKISGLLGYSTDYISCDEGILDRSLEFEKYGLMGMDAVHIACAEKAKAKNINPYNSTARYAQDAKHAKKDIVTAGCRRSQLTSYTPKIQP